MEVLRPTTLPDALAARAAHPGALAIAGGTDVMVELNFDKARPPAILDLTGVPELGGVERADGAVRIGAGVPYTRVIEELGDVLPALAQASRTVGSPQIRNRGTIGGNLGTASPAGDAHPPLLAADATVEVASTRGTRTIPVRDFFLGPGRSALEPDELVLAVGVPVAGAREQFAKIGTRNAMVISVCSFALRIDPERRRSAPGSARRGRRRCGPRRRRSSSRRSSTSATRGTRTGRSTTRRASGSARWSRPRRGRSTTTAGAPPTAATRSACSPPAHSPGHAADLHRQRRAARGRPRLGGGEPALRAARAARPARRQERLRAGRVRLLLRPARRRARLRLPGAGGAGRGQGAHRPSRGSRPTTTRSTPSSRRSSTPARCNAASARRG